MSKVNITIGEIIKLCEFVGVKVDEENSVHAEDPEQLETQMTIHQSVPIYDDDGQLFYEGIAATFTEYPEEGSFGLRCDNK